MLLKNGTVNNGKGFSRADVRVEDGKIVEIGENLQPKINEELIDVSSKVVLNGFVDVHVHFREPGFGYKETIATGSMAAAAGGYTTVCTMPNLSPAPDSLFNIQVQKDIIANTSKIKILPIATITKGQKGRGELIDFEEMKHEIGFSDDGRGVQADLMMDDAMREVAKFDGMIIAHCEVESLLNGGYIHDGEYCRRHNHKGICSQSEWEQVKRDVELASKHNCRYHVCHISTKESVDIIRRAKAKGVRVTCETAPHYLLLTDDDIKEEGRFKMNPPIRSKEDRDALIEGVIDGTIDVIATDHAPHSEEEKSRGLHKSAFGIVGLETAFALLYTHFVKKDYSSQFPKISFERLIELLSIKPREVFRVGGGLSVGEDADITVVDIDKEWIVSPSDFLSKGKATPFEGWKVYGKVEMTFVNGERVF